MLFSLINRSVAWLIDEHNMFSALRHTVETLPAFIPHPLFWVKKKNSQKEEKLSGQGKENCPAHLTQSLNPPLIWVLIILAD